jgi:stage II sporulation protein D
MVVGLVAGQTGAIGAATVVADGGGRDISVAMFSTRQVHAATLTAAGGGSWTAMCSRCAHELLTAPKHVSGAMEIFAGGPVRVTDDASGEARAATGLWHLRGSGGGVDVVLTLPSEHYVAAVLSAEAAVNEPAESLRALAILARTYALNGKHYTAAAGQLAAEVCDSSECQAMTLGPASPAIEDAVRATAGETLWFGGRRAEVFFSQSCGGTTEDASAVWPALAGVPYLRSRSDPYCVRRGNAAWHAEVPLATFAEIARAEGWHVPARIVGARVIERSGSHRALRVGLTGGDGRTTVVAASALRFGIGRALGWNQVRSDAYEVGMHNEVLVFDGRGHGHGVGLCQEGATEMAAEGKSAREILEFYFPGTVVRILEADTGWREARVGSVTVRGTSLNEVGEADMALVWGDAQRRFAPKRAVAPEIVFAPTAEVFRQMTGQPGWMLASTRGSQIVLQPGAVLRAHGRNVEKTLLHEMLHVLVESEAGERAPLWLREGLVEVLAGEDGGDTDAGISLSVMEGALHHTDSLIESERAHHAAAATVRRLVARYGLPVVRSWLSGGVPAGIV